MALNNRKKVEKERKRGIMVGLIAAVVGTIAAAAILLFGFQDGLSVTDRCHCSWTKVIAFSASAFLVLALQTVGYFMYQKKCSYYANSQNTKQKAKWRNTKMQYFLLLTVIFVLVPLLLFTLGVSFFADQNRNVLWMFQSGMGILYLCVTLVEAAVISVLQKLLFTQEVQV